MLFLFSKICFLLLLSLLQVKCCKREDFHYIKITEKSVSPDNTTKIISEFFKLGGGKHSLILPIEGLSPCRENIQEYEENVKKAYLVDVRNHFVPILRHGDVHDLENLKFIILEENAIEEVQPGAFLNVPALKTISLDYNNIGEIQGGVFNNLNIEKLSLNNNNISYIAPDAFDNMPNLLNIDLGNNKLQNWNPDWLTNAPKIRELSLNFNELTKIPEGAFNKLANSLKVLNLSNNKIHEIHAAVFTEMKNLRKLSLESNEFDCLSDEVLKAFPKNLTLGIAPNDNIQCLCWSKIEKWSFKYYAANKDTIFFTVRHAELECNTEIAGMLHEVLKRLPALEKQ